MGSGPRPHPGDSHGARESISAETTDNTLRIRTTRASGSRGPGGLVDYQITVPRWMPVNLTGTYLDATIEGTAAEVTVETVHGNARVTRRQRRTCRCARWKA